MNSGDFTAIVYELPLHYSGFGSFLFLLVVSFALWVECVSLKHSSEKFHILRVTRVKAIVIVEEHVKLLLEDTVRIVEILEVILAVKRMI